MLWIGVITVFSIVTLVLMMMTHQTEILKENHIQHQKDKQLKSGSVTKLHMEDEMTTDPLDMHDAHHDAHLTASLRKVPGVPVQKETNIGKVESENVGKLHAVTYATHGGRDDRFCRAVESSIRNGVDLTILGWGLKWHGLSQKLTAAYDYAKNLPDKDLLLFTDAYDVLFLNSTVNIYNTYADMIKNMGHTEGASRPILFSAECGCWPHVTINRGKACFQAADGGYPESPTPYRYLNSGTWLGGSKEASKMLLDVIKEAGSDFRNANDQKLVADMYMAGRHGIKLDFYNRIFQSMHMTRDPPLPHCDPTKDVKTDSQGNWFNFRTRSHPAVIHFNGGGKSVHLSMEGQTWYRHPQYGTKEERMKLGAHVLKVPTAVNGQMRFDELCRNYVYNS
jgi:hypothetical protein